MTAVSKSESSQRLSKLFREINAEIALKKKREQKTKQKFVGRCYRKSNFSKEVKAPDGTKSYAPLYVFARVMSVKGGDLYGLRFDENEGKGRLSANPDCWINEVIDKSSTDKWQEIPFQDFKKELRKNVCAYFPEIRKALLQMPPKNVARGSSNALSRGLCKKQKK